jgi:hypothetical protein
VLKDKGVELFPTSNAQGLGWASNAQSDVFEWTISVMVPQEGLEPPHPCEYQILSLARLPVPPLGHASRSLRAQEAAGEQPAKVM